MSGRRFALLVLLLLGGGLGVLIAGIPSISPEMETTVSAGDAATTTTTTTAPFRGTTAPTSAAAPVHAPEDVTVIVLNAASVEGAAGEISELLADADYSAMTPSNTDPFEATTVFFSEGYEGDAQAVAAIINPEVTVAPLDPDAFDAADDAHVVVVLGEDYLEITPVGDDTADEEPDSEQSPPDETPSDEEPPPDEEAVAEEAAV